MEMGNVLALLLHIYIQMSFNIWPLLSEHFVLLFIIIYLIF